MVNGEGNDVTAPPVAGLSIPDVVTETMPAETP
jgi:hypothetical protein